MRNNNTRTILLIAIMLAATMATRAGTPQGWFAAGSRPKDYTMSVDRTVAHSGKASALLKSVALKSGRVRDADADVQSGCATAASVCACPATPGRRM